MKDLFLAVCDWLNNRGVTTGEFYCINIHENEAAYSIRLQGHYQANLVTRLSDANEFTVKKSGYVEADFSAAVPGGETAIITVVLT